MNQKPTKLPLLSCTMGVITMVLRYGLYAVGLDEKNMLVSGHILSILVWVSALLAAVVICLSFAKYRHQDWEIYSEQPSILGALGALTLSAAIGVTVYAQGLPFAVVEKLLSAVGLICVPALLVSGFCRLKGRRPFFMCHGCICVYFALYLVRCYGVWSANPQLQDYVFAMLACVCLALFAYQQTAMDTDMGNGKFQCVLGLMAGYLGIAALCGAEYPWLYLAGSLWALTNLSRPAVATWYRRAKEES